MPSVVRSTVLLGALALAVTTGLTACGDKVNVQQPSIDSTVHQVTVSPPSVNMQVGDKVTLAASVTAGAGQTNLNVTWTSSNAAVASVDANGIVTAVGGGTCSIVAASAANPAIKGAAVISVGAVVQPTVTIATINQTTGAGSVPANLGNVIGQLDVTLNVDPGTQKLSEVDLVATVAGHDTVVATESLSSSDVAPVEAAASPITLSFNTAFFNSTTGAVSFRNGPITIKGVAKTTQGTQSASGSQALTLNNTDAIVGSIALGQTALDINSIAWAGTSVTVTATPVFYTPGRTAVSSTVNLAFNGAGNAPGSARTQTIAGAGSVTATFSDGNGANNSSPTDINQLTNTAVGAVVTAVDNSGLNFQNPGNALFTPQSVLAAAPLAVPNFRLDTQKPKAGNFHLPNAPTVNPDQGIGTATGYVGAAFKFKSDSASGYRGPDSTAGNQTQNLDNVGGVSGVGKVAVVFQFRVGSSGSFTTVSDVSTISESVTNSTYTLREITTDALGNADTTTVGTFGVDKTPPTFVIANTSPADKSTDTTATGFFNTQLYNLTISDNLSGPGTSLVAQVRNWNGLSSVNSGNEGRINSNTGFPGVTAVGSSATATQQPCYIGRFNATQAAAGANAIAVFNAAGTAVGFCTPVLYNLTGGATVPAAQAADGYWATTVVVNDAAANSAVALSRTVLEDPTPPTIINIDPPATAVGNGSVAFPANIADNAAASVGDVVGSWINQFFTGGVVASLQFPITAGPGVAFDNVLTNTATATPTLTNYIKNLQPVADSLGAGTTGAIVAGNNNNAVIVTSVGAAGNHFSLTYIFQPGAPQLVAGSSNTWPCPQTSGPGATCTAQSLTDGWSAGSSNPVVSVCAASGCTGNAAPTKPLSTTLTVSAGGPSLTFTNPMLGGAVSFWYRTAATPANVWYFAGNGGGGSARDNGTHRFWDFSFTFTPPTTAPGGENLTVSGTVISIMAIGVAPSGDAIANSVAVSFTTVNP